MRRLTRCCFLLAIYALSAGTAWPETRLDNAIAQLGDQFGHELESKARSIIVVDFLTADGKTSFGGWYLADLLSEHWLTKKHKFRIVDRSELPDTHVSAEDVASPEII